MKFFCLYIDWSTQETNNNMLGLTTLPDYVEDYDQLAYYSYTIRINTRLDWASCFVVVSIHISFDRNIDSFEPIKSEPENVVV